MQRNVDGTGSLYVVGTPIGNLEDITFRAVRILREVDFIAAEDTRHTKKLLTHFDIPVKDLFSYHEHNERTAAKHIVDRVLEGQHGAVVSDAGMPAISDPGQEVVNLAIAHGISVIVVPGPSAVLTALCGSGLATGSFYFHGFLSREAKHRQKELEALRNRKETLIFYEAPHRIEKTLNNLHAVFGDRQAVVARELTKVHEEYIRGCLTGEDGFFGDSPVRGEMVIVVQGIDSVQQEHLADALLPITQHVQLLVQEGADKKEAMREVARLHGISRRDVYQALLDQEAGQEENP